MNDFNKRQYFLDSAALIGMGLFSLGYVLFSRVFAELHIQLPFLDFPIFVGEVLLLICLVLFLVKYGANTPRLPKWHYWIIGYFMFVVLKAMYGYLKWGALALRDSALLYYPAFIVFGYAFYRKDFFDGKKISLACLIIAIFILGRFYEYWALTLAIFAFVLLKSYSRKAVKFALLLVLFSLIPYDEFFETSRMMILSNFIFGMYLTGIAPVLLVNKKKWRLALFIFMGGLVILGLLKFADRDKVKSIFNVKKMAALFEKYDKDAAAIDRSQMPEPAGVQLYNPDKLIPDHPTEIIFNDRILSDEQMKAEMKQVLIERVRQKVADFSFEGRIPDEHILEVKKEVEEVLVKLENEIPVREVGKAGAEMISDEVFQSTGNEVSENTAPDLKNKEEHVSASQIPAQPVSVEGQISSRASEQGTREAKQEVKEEVKREIIGAMLEQVDIEMRTAPLERLIGNDKIPPAMYSEARMSLQADFQDEMKRKVTSETPGEPFEKKWIENNNAIFRLLIWRDMWLDLKNEKPMPILGLDFGRPFRSRTLEALQWGLGDWIRDGWIGAHNSFFHIIYRTGIVGALLIGGLFVMLFRMIRAFIFARSLTGILLCGIILNWFIAANFLLIFELPYTAIPIWTIYGMTLAYYSQIRGSRHSIGPTQV